MRQKTDENQWRSQPDNLVPLCKFQSIIIIHSVETDCFHSQSIVNICIAGLNLRAGYATDENNHSFAYIYKNYHTKYFIRNPTRYRCVDLI